MHGNKWRLLSVKTFKCSMQSQGYQLQDKAASAQEVLSVKESMIATLAHDSVAANRAFKAAFQALPALQTSLQVVQAVMQLAGSKHSALNVSACYALGTENGAPIVDALLPHR